MDDHEIDDDNIDVRDIDFSSMYDDSVDDANKSDRPAPKLGEPRYISYHLDQWFASRDRHNRETETGIRRMAQRHVELFNEHPFIASQPALKKFVFCLAEATLKTYKARHETLDLLNSTLELVVACEADVYYAFFGIRCSDEHSIDHKTTREIAQLIFRDVYKESESLPASIHLLMQESPGKESSPKWEDTYRSFDKITPPAPDSRVFDLVTCMRALNRNILRLDELFWSYIALHWESYESERMVC